MSFIQPDLRSKAMRYANDAHALGNPLHSAVQPLPAREPFSENMLRNAAQQYATSPAVHNPHREQEVKLTWVTWAVIDDLIRCL